MKRRVLPFFETPTDAGGGGGSGSGGPDWETRAKAAEHELEKVRRQAAGYRVGNRGTVAEVAQALAATLGVSYDPERPPNASELAGTLGAQHQKLQAEAHDWKLQSMLSDAIHERGMNPRLTRAYLREEGVLAKLDPSKADFEEQIETALDDAIHAEPALRGASNAPRQVGADFHGGGGMPNEQYTLAEVSAMKPEDVVKLRRAGKLGHLMGGR